MRTTVLEPDGFKRRLPFLSSNRSRSSTPHLRYKYNALKENQIRLLRLYPGASESRIRCHLHTVDLLAYEDIAAKSTIEGWERFDAISYVWGDPERRTEIDCDGFSASVTVNLADALRRFRDPSEAQVLWADALCINQNDDSERASQVKLMGLIYFKARRVRIWLGHDDDIENQQPVRHAIELIKQYSRLYESCSPDPGDKKLEALSESLFQGPESFQLSRWSCVRRLLERPWFTRVWVVQELGLSRSAEFYCGDCSFNRDELEFFERVLTHSKSGLAVWHDLELQIVHLGQNYWRSAWSNVRIELGEDAQEAETFFDILRSARGLQCTERKDSIYAFLGHPSAFKRQLCDLDPYFWYPTNYYEKRRPIIEPNYKKSYTFSSLCIDLALSAVQDCNIGLNMLASIAHSESTIDSDFASWTPRWDLLDAPWRFVGNGIYYAASKGLPDTTFSVKRSRRSPKRRRLLIKALCLGTVRVVLNPPTIVPPEHLANSLAQLLGDIPREGEVPHISPPKSVSYPYDDEFLTALAMTMTAGLTSGSDFYVQPADNHKDHHLNTFMAFYRQQQAIKEGKSPDPEDDENANYFAKELERAAGRRLVFLTTNGRFGLGPSISEYLDEVWLPMGAKMPFVLRPTGKGTYKLLGQTFIHGVMRGEAVQGKSEMDFESIVLV